VAQTVPQRRPVTTITDESPRPVTAPRSAAGTPGPVPHRPAALHPAVHRHVPGRASPGRSLRRRAIAQHPRHDDQARSPLVPVLAPLRVRPPCRTPHAHDTIRTRIRLAAQRPPLPMIRGRGRCGVPWPYHQQAPRPGTSSVRAAAAAHRDTRGAALDPAALLARLPGRGLLLRHHRHLSGRERRTRWSRTRRPASPCQHRPGNSSTTLAVRSAAP
jgi:hypothetical protein